MNFPVTRHSNTPLLFCNPGFVPCHRHAHYFIGDPVVSCDEQP